MAYDLDTAKAYYRANTKALIIGAIIGLVIGLLVF